MQMEGSVMAKKQNRVAGVASKEKFHVNSVDVEGIVTKVWDRNTDVFARLAIYDEFSEVLEPAEDGGLPKRQAHYVTLQFSDGKTADGAPVSISVKDHVRVTGYLRDAPYSESLTTFLRKAKKFKRIEDRDDNVRVGRVATYVVVRTLIRFSR
jgi:ABC-type branched-subunit amino acid transport system substrate-binding protein